MKRPALEIGTIGHSTRSLEDFVGLLNAAEADLVVDVRAIPRSRTNPQYNKETLPRALKRFGIGYLHLPELGGRRKKVAGVEADVNAFWLNRSFHNYADYALTDEFRRGLRKLLEAARSHRCVIMCSEAVWWRCHRRIIADHLLALGVTVFHLMGEDRIEPARITPGATTKRSRAVVYPA